MMIKKPLLFLAISIITHFAYAQESDSIKDVKNFTASVSVTNNGISLLPNFSLGKPAAIFEMKAGGKITFEPQLRFSMLEAQPWSFIFWWRYKLLTRDKFRMHLGAHPALIFRPVTTTENGTEREVLTPKRYLAAEISPNYFITKNISVGVYYLYSHGLDPGATRNVHFVTVNSGFSNIRLIEQFYMNIRPQLYYLRMDENEGFYFTSALTLARKNFPLAISSILNRSIRTNISAESAFVWNISLVYSFNHEYVRNQ